VNDIRSIAASAPASATTRVASVEETRASSVEADAVGRHGTVTAPSFIAPTRDEEDPVLRLDAELGKGLPPYRGSFGELEERPRLDDPVVADERQGLALRVGRERLDDVAREVEAIRDRPAVARERGTESELQWGGRLVVRARSAFADAKSFHGPSIIDPFR
jgi:hypothetical protein